MLGEPVPRDWQPCALVKEMQRYVPEFVGDDTYRVREVTRIGGTGESKRIAEEVLCTCTVL